MSPFMNIPNQPTFVNQPQIYTKLPFIPLIPYGQSISLNLLIIRIFNTKNVDIPHFFSPFCPYNLSRCQ